MTTPIAGVYALLHRPTRRVYVGSSASLRARLAHWRQVLRSGDGLPVRLAALPRGTDDWEIRVIQDCSNMTVSEIHAAEQRAILHIAATAPERLLNASVVGRRDSLTAFGKTKSLREWASEKGIARTTIRHRLGTGCSPEDALEPQTATRLSTDTESVALAVQTSRVLIMDGDVPMTKSTAATRLGCTKETLSKRVSRYQREDGQQARIQISDLEPGSRAYHAKNNLEQTLL